MAKILIVDDSASQRNQLRVDLEKAGHEVLEATDGLLGYEVAKHTPAIDVIISDVNMPHLNGIEMCKRIHNLEIHRSVPLLMLTTEATTEMKARGKAVGVTAWATKPYDPKRVLEAIKLILTRQNLDR